MQLPLKLTVNGDPHELYVDASTNLLQFVRLHLGLSGSKEGCDDSECGACMMLVDDRPVNSCSYLALQANGRAITTVEGLAQGAELHPLQSQFAELGGVQCGYCTSGMLMSAAALLKVNRRPSDEEIRWALSGNLCRCTGYSKIIEAVRAAAHEMAAK
jgi:aerobic-type carbon monoxide dehydrogenase small subunit (CoxS/CutS family)